MNPEQVREDWLNAVIDRAFIGEDALPRSEKEFQAQKQRARTRLPAVSEGLSRLAAEIGQEFAVVRERLGSAGPALSRPSREMQEQLRHLVYAGFDEKGAPWGIWRICRVICRPCVCDSASKITVRNAMQETLSRSNDFGSGIRSASTSSAKRALSASSWKRSAGSSKSCAYPCSLRS